MKTEVQVMHGIPDGEIETTVRLLKADPRYVSHEVIPEGAGKNTIKVTFKVDE
jgi:hypothetical protein